MSLETKINRREFIKEASAYAAITSTGLGIKQAFPKVVRVAVIGLGTTGVDCLTKLGAVAGVEIVAVCDRSGKAFQKTLAILDKPRLGVYDDPAKLLDREHFDGVVLAVPQKVQDDLMERLLAKEKPLYTERPIRAGEFSRPLEGGKGPVVFGRPLGIDESSRDALEAASLRIKGIRQVDIRIWADVNDYHSQSTIPAGTFAEAIAPALPVLRSWDLLVSAVAGSSRTSPIPAGPWTLSVQTRDRSVVQQSARIEVNVRHVVRKTPRVSSWCRYRGVDGAVELHNGSVDPRRQGLALFVSQSVNSKLRFRPERVHEQQVALEFEQALICAMVAGRSRLKFNAA